MVSVVQRWFQALAAVGLCWITVSWSWVVDEVSRVSCLVSAVATVICSFRILTNETRLQQPEAWYLPVAAGCTALLPFAQIPVVVHAAGGAVICWLGWKQLVGWSWTPRRMDGRTVVVTGANTGIGLETARRLAEQGATVILACRSETRAQEAKKQLPAGLDVRFMPLDLASFDSVREFHKKYCIEVGPKLDVLILNAGVMLHKRALTVDGCDTVMQVNHIAQFLLARLFEPQLKQAKGKDGFVPRVVVLASSLSWDPDSFDFGELFRARSTEENEELEKRPFSQFVNYANTKFANVVFVQELSRRWRQEQANLAVFAVNPGTVSTEVHRDIPIWGPMLDVVKRSGLTRIIFKSIVEGAWTSLHCATTSDVHLSGEYFCNCAMAPMNPAARDAALGGRLWDATDGVLQQ
mmetsp:Transcript_16389/g.41879  ORF Transcript_16389/g.41879 Transcript_16389/m.41879 type:complete len:409 (-) Transcript_16389:11-1237(-)